MRVQTAVVRRGGRPVVIKRAMDPDGRRAIEHEGRVLGLARHPGVVELVDQVDDELVLRFVGSHTLATSPCRSPEHAAGLIAALAETVAALHQVGIVHGRIAAEHVVVDREGHPILVGFSGARVVEAGADDPPSRADDVANLGALLRWLLLEQPDREELVPARRWRTAHGDAVARRALLTLADHATADDPRIRPVARRLAAAILTTVPTALLVAGDEAEPDDRGEGNQQVDVAGGDLAGSGTDRGGAAPDHRDALDAAFRPERPPDRPADRSSRRTHRRHPLRGRGITAALALLGLTLFAFGATSMAHGPRPSLDASASGPPSAAPAVDAPPSPPPQSPPLPPDAATTTPVGTAPVPPLRIEPAGIVQHAGRSYAIGEPGDEIAIGAFDCAAADRAAVLRPATGEIFVFEAWAEPHAARRAGVAAHVPVGSHWAPPSDTCSPLAVRSPTDEHLPVPLTP